MFHLDKLLSLHPRQPQVFARPGKNDRWAHRPTRITISALMFEYTSDMVTVGSSNTMQLQLIENYPEMSGFLGLLGSSGYSGSKEWFLD